MKRRVRGGIFGYCAAVETVIRTPRPNLVDPHEHLRSVPENGLTGGILGVYRHAVGLDLPAKAAEIYTDVGRIE